MRFDLVDQTFRIEVSRLEQLLAFKLGRTIAIPLRHITRVSVDEPESSSWDIRAPGTAVPRLIKAGTYYTKRGKEFWYWTRRGGGFLVLDLVDEPYKRIVLSTPENIQWVERFGRR